MHYLMTRALLLSTLLVVAPLPSFCQTPEAPKKIATNLPVPTKEPKGATSDEMEDVHRQLREQREELERLRTILTEQSKIITELRAADSRTNQNALGVSKAPAMTSDDSKQINVAERLGGVEAQVKKTSETLSKQLGSITFSGDIRLRMETFFGLSNSLPTGSNPAALGNELSPRYRGRIRARLGMRGQIGKEFDWGLRVATGSLADNISTNQTLTDLFNRKPFALDQAYITYKPKQVPGLRLQGGKFEAPWTSTEMLFDSDLQFEGINEMYSRNFKGSTLKNLTFVAWQLPLLERNSGFVRNSNGTVNVEQSRRAGRDLGLFGAQLSARFEPSAKVAFGISVADHYFSGTQFITPVQIFGSQLQVPVSFTIPANGTTPAQTVTTTVSIPRDLLTAGNGNLGLTNASVNATNRDGRLSSGYNLVDVLGRLELKHNNRFPVLFLFDFVHNTLTRDVVTAGPGGTNLIIPNKESNGYWAEVQVGKTKEQGDMLFGYTLMRIEKDAVLTPFNFSDITQQSDSRAHRMVFSYAADPRVIFTVTGIVTQRPHGVLGVFGTTPPDSLNRPTTRFQFDTMFKF
ncbi:MAG TPA: putative porin [Pyrinomonadaceae bacterium]|nr:putative porin [Pyrinomonadaceae bacterium]